MVLEFDLTTEQGLSIYLTSQSIAHTSVILLTGGTANYVYRVILPTGETTIYKHAAPYLHSNTNFAFDPSRMDYEDRILELLPSLLKTQLPVSCVHAVAVNSYDRDRKLLCLSDGGSKHLKDAYTDTTLHVPKIGQDLGRWLAALHSSTVSTPLTLAPGDQDLKANNPVAVSIYRHSYKNLSTAFAAYSEPSNIPRHTDSIALPNRDVEFATQINDAYGSRLAHDNECICHGDFWPGNVLVNSRSSTGLDKQGETVGLTVVDWEMTRRGTSATDVAQFCAEAFLLDRFRGARGLLSAFLNAYLDARLSRDGEKLGREWLRRVAVHWGVHVAFWPTRVEWTDRAGTQELVEIGKRVLKAATESRWEALFASEVFGGVEGRFREGMEMMD